MAVSVSGAVFQEVQQKVADHQANVNLLQNQLSAGQAGLDQWSAILADLVNADVQPVSDPAPPVDPSQPLG